MLEASEVEVVMIKVGIDIVLDCVELDCVEIVVGITLRVEDSDAVELPELELAILELNELRVVSELPVELGFRLVCVRGRYVETVDESVLKVELDNCPEEIVELPAIEVDDAGLKVEELIGFVEGGTLAEDDSEIVLETDCVEEDPGFELLIEFVELELDPPLEEVVTGLKVDELTKFVELDPALVLEICPDDDEELSGIEVELMEFIDVDSAPVIEFVELSAEVDPAFVLLIDDDPALVLDGKVELPALKVDELTKLVEVDPEFVLETEFVELPGIEVDDSAFGEDVTGFKVEEATELVKVDPALLLELPAFEGDEVTGFVEDDSTFVLELPALEVEDCPDCDVELPALVVAGPNEEELAPEINGIDVDPALVLDIELVELAAPDELIEFVELDSTLVLGIEFVELPAFEVED